jgi:hypothetical protein
MLNTLLFVKTSPSGAVAQLTQHMLLAFLLMPVEPSTSFADSPAHVLYRSHPRQGGTSSSSRRRTAGHGSMCW